MRCDNRRCGGPIKGKYFKLFPGYLPVPCSINRETMEVDNSGLGDYYPGVLLWLRLDDERLKNTKSGEFPHEFCCPFIKEIVSSRICIQCGVYFAPGKSLKAHKTYCGKDNSALNLNLPSDLFLNQERVRPVRIAARRPRDLMIVWRIRLKIRMRIGLKKIN